MTLTHIANLLDPLQSAIALQSWEDAEDIAKEISRLCRLKRLSELDKIQEALKASGSHQGLSGKSTLENNPSIAPEGSQMAKTPLPETIAVPNSLDVVSLETRFDEKGHSEPWRNQLARELNTLLAYARHSVFQGFRGVTISLAARIAQFEQIQVER